MRKAEIADFCEYTLQKMQEFDIDFYFKMLRMKGYEVTPRYDKSKKLVGYTIGKNASVFKFSEVGRRFMASQLEVEVNIKLLHLLKGVFAEVRNLRFPHVTYLLRLLPSMPHIDNFRSHHCPYMEIVDIVGIAFNVNTAAVHV